MTIEGRGELRFYWGTETQLADDELNGSGTTHPAYRGQAYVVALDLLLGQNAQVPNLTFVVARYPDPAWLTSGSNVGDDCHPVAVIGDLWQHPRFGLGESSDGLDTATLNATAAVLTSEGVGLSGVIDQADTFPNLLARLLENFDGYVSYDAAGRFGVKLIRGEEGDGLTFDENDLTADPDLEVTAWPDTINQVTLTFRNRDKQWQEDSVAWHDRAAFAIQGATKTESIQRPWITRQDLAWQVAAAWCQQRALPRITGRISLKAGSAGSLAPGDTFSLTFASNSLSGLLCRVEEISRRSPESAEVDVRLLEDRGYLNGLAYSPAADDPVEPETYSPQQIAGARLFETPYGFQREEHTHFQLLAARGDAVTGRVHSWNEVAPDSYEFYRSTRTFCLMATLNGALSKSGPVVDEDGGLLLTITSPDKTPYDATFAEAMAGRSVLFLGTEVFLVWGPTLVSGNQYAFSYVRAAYACEKEDHADGAQGFLIFPSASRPYLTCEWGRVALPGESLKWKFQAELLGVTTDLAGAGVYQITSTARAYLPLVPINLTVNGDGHCPTYGTGESVVVDWDMASPLRNLHPVEEDCPSHFADATKLQILDVTTDTVQWETTFPTTGNATISNATILAALGAETDFVIRAWNQRAGLNSTNHTQITVRRT